MPTYGLTPQGFVLPRQSDIVTDLGASIVSAFGSTTNVASETLLGQLIGILAEREALLWEAMDDLVANASPSGAEGIFVDNLLAYSGLKRLAAQATVTNPTPSVQSDGRVLYGLVLYGTPGTVIPAGSIVQSTTIPVLSFTLDSSVTIQPAANALQRLYYSIIPDSGAFQLQMETPSGAIATSVNIDAKAQAQQTLLTFPQLPSQGTFVLSVGTQASPVLPFNVSAMALQIALQTIPGQGMAGVTGSTTSGFSITWNPGTMPLCGIDSTAITWAVQPTQGVYKLVLNNAVTNALPYSAAASDLQREIRLLPGYGQVGVSGTLDKGFALHWNGAAKPTMAITGSTLDAQPTVSNTSTLNATPIVINSVQASVNALQDSGTGKLPFTDVGVTSPFAGQFLFAFGANAPLSGQPSSAQSAQGRIVIGYNVLQAATGERTNIGIVQSVLGAAAEGVGTATCTDVGPNAVTAGQLTLIGSGQSGWTSVTNQLDTLTGRNLETDTEALARRSSQLASRGNGPLASVVAQVQQLEGVTAAIGFANTTAAALQRLSFATPPTSGSFVLSYNGALTSSLPFNASAADVQTALASLANISQVLVAGSAQYGYQVDFNGSQGGQAQPLLAIAKDTTGAQLAASYGRPPKSIEIVVEGGDDTLIAETILASAPAGIATYGAPALVTTASAQFGSTVLPMASVANIEVGMALVGQGIRAGSQVLGIAGNNVTMSLSAIGSTSQTPVIVNHTLFLEDSANNPVQVSFSRPLSTIIYVTIKLVTDLYRTPGVPSSGINPTSQWDPASVSVIQENILNIGDAIPIGGVITAKGTNGLVGCFNEIGGIVDYTIYFDTVAGSTNEANVPLQSEQVAQFETYNVSVSYR